MEQEGSTSSRPPVEDELVRELDRAAARLTFLSGISQVLSDALSDRECFQKLLTHTVPLIADWATLTLINEKGEIYRAASTHADPAKAKILRELNGNFPPRIDDPSGPGHIIHTGQTEFFPNMGEEFEKNIRWVRYPRLAEIVRQMGILSKIAVPLVAHGTILGVLWLATSDSGRIFTEEDCRIAEEVARRTAMTAFHLNAFTSSSKAVDKLRTEQALREEFIANIRHDVLSTLTSAMLSAQLIERGNLTRATTLAKRIVGSIEKATDMLISTRMPNSRNAA